MEDIRNIIKITKNINLLYVEDNKNTMKSSIFFFEEFFNNIITAVDGVDGLEKFKSNDFDIVITDLSIPKLNGLKMIEEIRKINNDISIIILTAHKEFIFLIESIKLGVSAYLLKPLNLDDFLVDIAKVVKSIHIRKENKKCIKIMKTYNKTITEIKQIAKNEPDKLLDYINTVFNNKNE